MSSTLALSIANIVSTWLMVGVIWTVQLVHYPTFAMVERAGFVAFHRFHGARITWIVLPGMTAELLTSILLAWRLGSVLAWLGLGCAAVTWLVTAGVSVPAHNTLGRGFQDDAHRRLVVTNWFRTVGFSAHGVVSVALICSQVQQ